MSQSTHANETPTEWHGRQLRAFIDEVPRLRLAAEELRSVLRRIADEVAPDAAVHVRVKSLLSVSEKILRGNNRRKYPEPMCTERGLSDLVGGQIVTYTRRDRDAVCRWIERLGEEHRAGRSASSMEIDEQASGDTASRLLPDQFGYTARHFIIRLHGEGLLGVPIGSASGCHRKMEVQVTLALSHAWGVVTHDRTYKSDLVLPARLHRRVAEAKAMLDAAERQLEEAIVDLDRYRQKHAGRLWAGRETAEGKANYERAVMVSDGVLALGIDAGDEIHKESIAGALEARAELAMASGEWQKAIDLLDVATRRRESLTARLAEAYQHMGKFGTAASLLDKLLELDPTHREAACARAELHLTGDRPSQDDLDRAAGVLEKAFLSTPDEPELLMAYSTARLLRDRDAARLCTMRGVFNAAIDECRKRHELGADVPECLLQHARLALYADDLFGALNAYCLAFLHGPTDVRLAQELRHIGLLRDRVRADASEPRVVALRVGLECVESLVELLVRCRLLSDAAGDRAVDEGIAQRFANRPIVIVAGGCEAMSPEQRERAESLLEVALRGYSGTVICGGTTSGLSGIVGRAVQASRESGRAFKAIGYLPPQHGVVQAGDRIDSRYDHHEHVAPTEPGPPTYSPLGPIRTWFDLLDAGIRPRDVRLVGVNGGDLAGFEFRLALAMGATVGLVEGSGRAAAELLGDSAWTTARPIARLFDDPDTLRFFISAAYSACAGADTLDDDLVERLAERFHENYRGSQISKPSNVHPAVLPWDKLADVYKESSLAQVRALSAILASEGFAIVPESDPREGVQLWVLETNDSSRRTENPEFKQQLDRMARLEHARWNAERLSLGWTLGPSRDLHAKTSPYLVPFDDLPPEIQRYDYEPFLSLPDSINALEPDGQVRWKVVMIG